MVVGLFLLVVGRLWGRREVPSARFRRLSSEPPRFAAKSPRSASMLAMGILAVLGVAVEQTDRPEAASGIRRSPTKEPGLLRV